MTELVESDEIIEHDINSKIDRSNEGVEENMDLFKTVQSNLLNYYPNDIYTMFFYYSEKPLFSKEETNETKDSSLRKKIKSLLKDSLGKEPSKEEVDKVYVKVIEKLYKKKKESPLNPFDENAPLNAFSKPR